MDGGDKCALTTTQLHGFEMTTAALFLLLLSRLAASETRGSGDETETSRMIGLFDLQEVLDEVRLRALASGHIRDRRLALEVSGKGVAGQNVSSLVMQILFDIEIIKYNP
jgi:hypothetical protein